MFVLFVFDFIFSIIIHYLILHLLCRRVVRKHVVKHPEALRGARREIKLVVVVVREEPNQFHQVRHALVMTYVMIDGMWGEVFVLMSGYLDDSQL